MVTRGADRTNVRTMVIPMTPPLAAMRVMASSVLQRALPGTSARQLECVTRTGFRDASMAFMVVRSPQCEMSRSEEHTSELQSPCNLVCRLLLDKKPKTRYVVGLDARMWLLLNLLPDRWRDRFFLSRIHERPIPPLPL